MSSQSSLYSVTCAGSSSGGALTELIALGAADQYLTHNPTITFWRFRYNKHTNYAMEAIEQPFNTVSFGSESQVILNRTCYPIINCSQKKHNLLVVAMHLVLINLN